MKTEFTLLVDIVNDKTVKDELLTKKLGDNITFDIYKLEDKDEAHINKYLLKKPEDSDLEIGNMFSATITEVTRVELAELNEEFFSTFGDESVTYETSLKEFLRKDIKAYYDNQALQFMHKDIMDRIRDNNEIIIPETFLKR